MTNIFQNVFKHFNEEKLEKIRKYFLLGASIVCGFLMLIVLLVPYLEYGLGDGELLTFTPIGVFYLLSKTVAWQYGIAYVGIAVFIIGIAMTGIALIFLGKGILAFFYDENKLAKNAKTVIRLSVILTCVYYLSSVILCAVFRATKSIPEMYSAHGSAPFIFTLIINIFYTLAVAFLNKVKEPKAELGEEFGTVKQQWIRKGIFLGLSLLGVIVLCCIYGVAFCLYKNPITGGYEKLRPNDVLPFVREGSVLSNNMTYSALATYVFTTIAVVIAVMLFAKCIIHLFSDEKTLVAAAKKSIVFSTVFTGLYFIGGVIVSSIFYMTGAKVLSAINFVPFLIMAMALIGYAVMLGLYHKLYLVKEDRKEVDTAVIEKKRKKRKNLYKARLELFICTVVIVALSITALLTNILTVTFEELHIPEISAVQMPTIKLIGFHLVKNYMFIDSGSQTLAFIIILLLTLIIAVFFFTLISFVSRSNVFYKISLGTIAVCTVSTFLVGMFGKYYQIVQVINEGIIKGYISSYFKEDWLDKALELGLNYTVSSHSLYYSLGSFAVIAYLLFRNPYTKGITLEREFALREENELPQTIQGEISLKDVPEEFTKLNDGRTVIEDKVTKEEKVIFADPCPIFTELDRKIPEFNAELSKKRAALFEAPTLPKLVQFIVEYARDSRLHLSYTEEDIATFIAGLGTTKLTILQGMSGTGKTSLPKIFAEALYARCEIVEVESSWRDKNELLGYYNEFSKNFTPKKFTQALYRAKLNPETLTFIVLDEMNLSRIEYYFSDFLSLMENEPDKRELRLLNVSLARTENGVKEEYAGLFEGHTIKIPGNVWFIGTANRDESTFEISDKVYDRAHTMNFNKRAPKVLYYNEPIAQRFLPVDIMERLFKEAKDTVKFNIDNYPVIAEVEKLLAPYNISFGNRIAMQIESFVDVYSSCFAASEEVIHTAVESILLSKVVSKLELKSVENKELLAAEFEKLNLRNCSAFILKLNED